MMARTAGFRILRVQTERLGLGRLPPDRFPSRTGLGGHLRRTKAILQSLQLVIELRRIFRV